MAVAALAFALVIATGLHQPVGASSRSRSGPPRSRSRRGASRWWFRASVRYIVTEKHVIWQRGRLRRSIDRDAISYAIIRWSSPGIGDLVLERAVPTGAPPHARSRSPTSGRPIASGPSLRGLVPGAPLGDGICPRAAPRRRLDACSGRTSAVPRWTARRVAQPRQGAPRARRGVGHRTLDAADHPRHPRARAPRHRRRVRRRRRSSSLMLVSVAVFVGYSALLRPWRLTQATRYFVTNQRVLIRRRERGAP